MSAATLVEQTFSRWSDHEGQRLGAALAFYSVLSFAPLLVFVLLVVSSFYGQDEVMRTIIEYARRIAGDRAADLAQMFLTRGQKPSHGLVAGVVGLVTLLFGASG